VAQRDTVLGDTCKMSATSVVRRQRGSSGAALPPGWAATAHPFHAAGPLVMPDPNETQVFVRPPQQAAAATMLLRHPAECRRNTKIMQTDPTARHSPIGSFQRIDYLVHLARDPVATARGVRSPALHPDRHCAQHRAPRGVSRGARRPAWSATTRQSHLGWQPSRMRRIAGTAQPRPPGGHARTPGWSWTVVADDGRTHYRAPGRGSRFVSQPAG
jgi:hypothetical protein